MVTELFKPFQPTISETGLSNFGLSLQSLSPSNILKGAVHSYLQITAQRPTPYPVMPDGSQSIFISPQGSMVGGARLEAYDIQILGPGEYFGIRFYPGALRYFFNLDVSEITGHLADQKFFPCRHFGSLHSDIYRRTCFRERAEVCNKWLLRRYTPQSSFQFDSSLSFIYKSRGNVKVSQLANSVGWSARHLNRVFLRHTGLSTKEFCQIIRIQHVSRQLYMSPDDSLKTALELGFFDQSHLLNDFKKHFSLSPRIFFNRFRSDFYN